jgi:uncharacterized membrane protein
VAVSGVFLFIASFLASAVEGVEALTIVLAVGLTRGWRSTMVGVCAAGAALAVVVAALGPALTVIPIRGLRVVVGGLLLVFGLQWLRKAILRASGFKALHDESEIYRRETSEAIAAASDQGARLDWYSFTVAFKGVLLEGLEVAFIVVTFGSNQGSIPLAVAGAVTAIVLVTALGIVLRAPLARVPENALKFTVGLLLTSFGTFWAAEGAGVSWPGSDASLPALLALYAASTSLLVAMLRRRFAARRPNPACRTSRAGG